MSTVEAGFCPCLLTASFKTASAEHEGGHSWNFSLWFAINFPAHLLVLPSNIGRVKNPGDGPRGCLTFRAERGSESSWLQVPTPQPSQPSPLQTRDTSARRWRSGTCVPTPSTRPTPYYVTWIT